MKMYREWSYTLYISTLEQMDMISQGFVKITSKLINQFKSKINIKVFDKDMSSLVICWAFSMVLVLVNRVGFIFLPNDGSTASFEKHCTFQPSNEKTENI
jgi:hypothetical protein